MSSADHWNGLYAAKTGEQVSWFEPTPTCSLELVEAAGIAMTTPILDVGGGRSRLASELRSRGYADVSVLDIAESVHPTFVADVTTWHPPRTYGLWHDRAVFHFLVDPEQRRAYLSTLSAAVDVGGKVIIATFASDGPERCSGLPVMRYSPESLATELASVLAPRSTRHVVHPTPSGALQRFVYVLFERC